MSRTCDICGAPARPRPYCNGDQGTHHHGKVHTILRGSTNDLADLCDEHYSADQQAWWRQRAGK